MKLRLRKSKFSPANYYLEEGEGMDAKIVATLSKQRHGVWNICMVGGVLHGQVFHARTLEEAGKLARSLAKGCRQEGAEPNEPNVCNL